MLLHDHVTVYQLKGATNIIMPVTSYTYVVAIPFVLSYRYLASPHIQDIRSYQQEN